MREQELHLVGTGWAKGRHGGAQGRQSVSMVYMGMLMGCEWGVNEVGMRCAWGVPQACSLLGKAALPNRHANPEKRHAHTHRHAGIPRSSDAHTHVHTFSTPVRNLALHPVWSTSGLWVPSIVALTE